MTWSHKIVQIKPIRDSLPVVCDVFHACSQWQVNLHKCSISFITETQFAIQTEVTLQPNPTERLHVDATIIRYFRDTAKNKEKETIVGMDSSPEAKNSHHLRGVVARHSRKEENTMEAVRHNDEV